MFFFNGLLYSSLAAIMWGCIQVIYFKNLDYIPPIEIVIHRGIWAFFFFTALITFKKKFINYFSIFKDKKKIFYLSISAILVSSNWLLFILSISKLIEYYIKLLQNELYLFYSHLGEVLC